MSTIDTTQPTPPSWQPTDATQPPPPVRKRRRPSKRLVAVLLAVLVAVAAIATLTVTTVQQHGKAVDARSTLADTRGDLKGAKADLGTTQDALSTAQANLDGTRATLTTTQADLTEMTDDRDFYSSWVDDCTVAMGAARQMTGAVWPLFNATDLDRSIYKKIDDLDKAGALIKAANAIIDGSGYDGIWALYDSCDLDGASGANA